MRAVPVGEITQELVRFDTQNIQNPEISGAEYQQGELAGFEVKEYVLQKWGRKCAYCGADKVPLEVEHIHPKSAGGSNRVSNLTLACVKCNQKKGNQPIEVFLKNKPDVLKKILARAKAPLKDAAAVNASRWALFQTLNTLGVPVTVGSGGQTKFNRKQLGWEKAHWLDAAAVGCIGALRLAIETPLSVTCKGQGGRQKAMLNKDGYPLRYRQLKPVHGWRNGDIARFQGQIYRVTPREKGSFELVTKGSKPFSRPSRYLQRVYRADSYAYA